MRMFRPGWFRAFGLLFLLGVVLAPGMPIFGQQDPSQAPSTPSSGERSDAARSLRLGVGDLLEIGVYNVPELSTKARIGNNGDVYLPLIDYVHLQGLTLEEAQALIEKRLNDGGFLKNPHATVFVVEYASQTASLLGEVARPGLYPVMGQRRLFDLVSAAGGFTDKAGKSITVTRRDQPDKPITLPLAKNPADVPNSNIEVYAGDAITIPKADIVYVVGDVARPSGFLMDAGNLSVLQAIALAGGTSRTAKLNDARILRKSGTGVQETPVPLKKMLEAKSPDLPMQADDILFVPTSAGKVLAGHTLQTALQAAATVSIIAVRP